MTEVKNLITLGIGAQPGGLYGLFTGGLWPTWATPTQIGCIDLQDGLFGAAAVSDALHGEAVISMSFCDGGDL